MHLVDPCKTMPATLAAAKLGDLAATDWLRVMAPDLADALDDDIDRSLRIADEIDFYLETINELATGE